MELNATYPSDPKEKLIMPLSVTFQPMSWMKMQIYATMGHGFEEAAKTVRIWYFQYARWNWMLIFGDSGTRRWRDWRNKEDAGGDEPLVPCIDCNRQHPPCNVNVAQLASDLDWRFLRQLWNACIQEWRLALEKEKGDGWRFASNGMESFLVKGNGLMLNGFSDHHQCGGSIYHPLISHR